MTWAKPWGTYTSVTTEESDIKLGQRICVDYTQFAYIVSFEFPRSHGNMRQPQGAVNFARFLSIIMKDFSYQEENTSGFLGGGLPSKGWVAQVVKVLVSSSKPGVLRRVQVPVKSKFALPFFVVQISC